MRLCMMLVAHLFDSLPPTCPNCCANMRIVALITEACAVQHILAHIGKPAEPLSVAPVRGPLTRKDGLDSLPDREAIAQPEHVYVFN